MSIVTQATTAIRQAEKYADKSRLLYALYTHISGKKVKLSPAEKGEFSDFIFGEIESLILLIPGAQSYKEKDFLFEYEYHLQNAIMVCHRYANELSEDRRRSLDLLLDLVDKEKFLENMVDEIFVNKKYDPETVKYMLAMTGLAKEEYHKGKLYQGLLHYQRSILKLSPASRDLIGAHIRSEMERYLENPLTPDTEANLELICDICRYFGKERFSELLKQALWIGNPHIRFYASATLLVFDCEVPASIIDALANDIEYANLTYGLLKRYRKESLFPAALATPEYLAQSDLVRWLTYPTELGKAPDGIEYVGKIRKGEIFYIFRFRSDSENLDEGARGEWLVGWSGSRGGTFSNFDPFCDYEQETLKKTLKNIKKKLL